MRAKDNELPRVVTATSTHQACPFDPVDDQLIPELVQLIADDTLGNPKSNFESELAELKPAQLLSEALLHAPIMPQPIVGVAMPSLLDRRHITLPTMSDQHQSPSPAAAAAGPAAPATAPATASVLLAAMADGIGDLTFATPSAARDALTAAAARHAEGLGDLGTFTLCRSPTIHRPSSTSRAPWPGTPVSTVPTWRSAPASCRPAATSRCRATTQS